MYVINLSTYSTTDFPIVSPDQLQFFEYSSSVSVSCPMDKHMNAWRVMTKLYKMSLANTEVYCNPAPSCTIDPTFEKHSGEYWCENDEGERSRTLNISITGLITQWAFQNV